MFIHTESDSETDDVADDAGHADVTKPRPRVLLTSTNGITCHDRRWTSLHCPLPAQI